MEENKKITPKLAVVSVLIATVLTGISVAFGYFIWNSMQNTNISFTVSGAILQLDDGADITGANLVPASGYSSVDAIKKSIKLKLKDDVTDPATVNIKLNINEISQYLAVSDFKWTLVKDTTVVSEGTFNGKSSSDVIELVTLSSDSTDSNKKLTTTLSKYILYLWIDGNNENDSNMQNQSFDFTLTVEGTNSALGRFPAVDVVESLDDGSNGDSGSGVYKVHHDEISSTDSVTGGVIPAVDDYRYYGANPDNYVCLDFEGSTACPDKHLYRIIGSIYDELEGTNRLKVIKATVLTDGTVNTFAWDMKSDGTKANIWATPTETRNNITNNYSNTLASGSSLMIMLNSGIWCSDTTNIGKVYDRDNQSGRDVDFTNYKLSSTVKSMIGDSRYYLAEAHPGNGNKNGFTTYKMERTGVRSDSIPTRYDENRPLYWEGNVGLMYPSDYVFAAGNTCQKEALNYHNNECYKKDWLTPKGWEWLQSPRTAYPFGAWGVIPEGTINGSYDDVSVEGAVRPVFSLKSDVIFSSGEGMVYNR